MRDLFDTTFPMQSSYTTLIGLDKLLSKLWAGAGEAKLLGPQRIFSSQHYWLEQDIAEKLHEYKKKKILNFRIGMANQIIKKK